MLFSKDFQQTIARWFPSQKRAQAKKDTRGKWVNQTVFALFAITILSGWFLSRRPADGVAFEAQQRLGVGNLFTKLREELAAAQVQRESEGVPASILAKSAEIEVWFTVRNTVTREGKVSPEIYVLSEQDQKTSEHVNKITVHLAVPESIPAVAARSENQTLASDGQRLGPLIRVKGGKNQ